ncbi:hypothetical protein [Nonomuraea sp. NPDC023979]
MTDVRLGLVITAEAEVIKAVPPAGPETDAEVLEDDEQAGGEE